MYLVMYQPFNYAAHVPQCLFYSAEEAQNFIANTPRPSFGIYSYCYIPVVPQVTRYYPQMNYYHQVVD